MLERMIAEGKGRVFGVSRDWDYEKGDWKKIKLVEFIRNKKKEVFLINVVQEKNLQNPHINNKFKKKNFNRTV